MWAMASVRVMTWNVQNLFEPGTGDGPETMRAYRAKLASLAQVIDAARPHIVALQEVGPPAALRALQQTLTWRMPYTALGAPDGRGIRVAFLSARVLREVELIRLFPPELLPVQVGDDPEGPEGPPTMNQLGRPALAVTIRAGGRDLTVVNCHLKSKLLTYPPGSDGRLRFSPRDENERARYAAFALYRRTAEATTLRCSLTQRMTAGDPDDLFVLAGDMNDEPAAATTQILQGPPGSEIGTGGFRRPDRGDQLRLWNLAPLLPPDQAHSRIYHGRGELIDHIFVSRALLDPLPTVRGMYPVGVTMPSVTDQPSEIRNVPGSDHAAITATFTV